MATSEKAVVSAQIDADVRRQLEREAEAADRTLSAQVRRVLVEHVRHERAEQEAST
jgi:hypothetical protein